MTVLDNYTQWHNNYSSGWLAAFQQTGKINWDLYPWPSNNSDVAGPGIDVRKARLVLVSSSGAYLPASQPAFDAENDLGDYGIRLIPLATPLRQIAYAHTHYDHTAVNADPQVLLPLNHLDEMMAVGEIGDLADNVISFMGYQPDLGRVVDECIPAIVAAAQRERANAAVLVPS